MAFMRAASLYALFHIVECLGIDGSNVGRIYIYLMSDQEPDLRKQVSRFIYIHTLYV